MNSSMRTSASGMLAQQRMVEVIANNLANVNTTGFKRSRVSFEDVLYETVRDAGSNGPRGAETLGPIQIGKGVRVAGVLRLHAQGTPENTQRPLDLAIDGEGLFRIERHDGTIAYTRDGSFTLDENGDLVTSSGYKVVPAINVPQDATGVTVSPNGTVTLTLAGSSTPVDVGRLELARFVNPSGLEAIGENQFLETVASGPAISGYAQDDGFGRVLAGTLEASNVEIVQEMTDMIAAQRAYEINAKAIRASEDMMSATHDLIR